MAKSLKMQEEALSSTPTESETTTPTFENTGSCSVSKGPTTYIAPAGKDVLQPLARQVEYYFSTTNLNKDTYVSTLRSLNDGYVPISIIANFGKVRTLVPYNSLDAVRAAAVEFSDLLEVVFINSKTGKRLSEGEDAADPALKTVEAVGPKSGEAIPSVEIKTPTYTPIPVVTPASTNAVQNTVVLREVPQGVDETHVRKLFSFDNCPQIQSMKRDVGNCWFVTLDTSSRDVMLDVMFELRKKKFESGEPVMARLKSGVAANRDATTNVPYYGNQASIMQAGQQAPTRYNNNGGRKNKKKKNNNNKSSKSNNRSNNSNNSNSSQNKNTNSNKGKNNNASRPRNGAGGKQQKKTSGQEEPQKDIEIRSSQQRQSSSSSQPSPPPSFGEEQFPALPSEELLSNSNKFEVEKMPEHDELGKNPAGSDSSSTATTSTSSSPGPQPQILMGGYAAALKKATAGGNPQPEKKHTPKTKESNTEKTKKTTPAPKPESLPKDEVSQELPAVNVQPPSWGRGSFADIVAES